MLPQLFDPTSFNQSFSPHSYSKTVDKKKKKKVLNLKKRQKTIYDISLMIYLGICELWNHDC